MREAKLGDFVARQSRGIVPNATPDTSFELYSVPAFETKKPEIVLGSAIGSNKQIVELGTVLLCKINPRINRAWTVGSFTGQQKIASTEWITFPPHPDIEPRYLAYYLSQNKIRDYLASKASGVGGSLMRVKPSTLEDLPVPLPAVDEQRLIVAELEKQFSRLEDVLTGFRRISTNLKRYKATVLYAAIEGRLVPRIGPRARVALGTVANVIDPQPSHRTPPVSSSGIPYVGLGDIGDDEIIDLVNARKVSREVLSEHRARYTLRVGDFVFGKIGTIGQPARLSAPFDYALSANLVLIQPQNSALLPGYAFWLMARPQFAAIATLETRATTQAAFGIKRIRAVELDLPVVHEQKVIVAEVDRRLSIVRELQADINANLRRAEGLRQAVLKTAFGLRAAAKDISRDKSENKTALHVSA